MEKGVRVLFWLFIIHGQAFVKHPTAQPDQLPDQPAIWLKGCHQKPSSVLKTLNVTNNEPGRCLLCCGSATQMVALRLDECICLTTASNMTPARGESLCSNPCSGDRNLKCGGQTTWSIYQRVTKTESMNLPPDATGCGVASMSSNGYAYKMVPCNTSSSLVCINSYTGCEDRFGDFTWSEAVAECGDMLSAILPDQSLCQTVTNHNSYWLGLYRSKAYTQRCETTTLATQSTGNPTEHYSIVTEWFTTATTTRHKTNKMPELITQTQRAQPSGSALPGLISQAETTTTQFPEPTRTPLSETSLSHSREPEHSVTKESTNHITTELYHDKTESPTATENSEANVISSSTATATSNDLSTMNRHPSVLSTLKEQTTPFGSSTFFKTARTSPIRTISNGQSSTTSSVTAKNKQTSSFTEAMHPSTPNAIPNMNSEFEKVEVKPAREMNTIDSSEKLTIAVSVVGTVLSTLLLAIFLMLCRISRILQKNSSKSINCPQLKHKHTPMNMSYLTDGVSSYPLHRTHDLVGKQQSPFPYDSVYTQRAQTRERASNTYISWTDGRSARRGTLRNTFSTLDRKSDYSDAWEGSLDDNIMAEDDERYYEPV